MSEKQKLEKREVYSFSKLSSFNTCRHGFYLTYIEHKRGGQNCFAQFGTLIHSIMERYANNKVDLFSLPDLYENEFKLEITEPFPKSKYCDMKNLYYNQGLDFLNSFMGYDGYKILEVEDQFSTEIDDWSFTGIIDLMLEDADGNIIVQDYKSKKSFKNEEEKHKYARQLYLYSVHVKKKFGKYPKTLRFMMFRTNTIVDIPFNKEDYNEAINWAKSTVKEIRECNWFYSNYDEFFCNKLCNHRDYCEEKPESKKDKRGKNDYRKGQHSKSKGKTRR